MTEPISRAAELHAVLREGELTPDESAEILALLERGGPEAEEFLDLVRLDALLEEGLRPDPGHGVVWAKLREVLVADGVEGEAVWLAVRSRIKPSRRLARARTRRNWILALPLAAAAGLVLALVFFLLPAGTGDIRRASRAEPPGREAVPPAQAPSEAVASRQAPRTERQRDLALGRAPERLEARGRGSRRAASDPWDLGEPVQVSGPEPLPTADVPEESGRDEDLAAAAPTVAPPAPATGPAAAAPREGPDETLPWLAEAEALEGALEYSRSAGAAWSRADGRVGLSPGDRVRTALARARIRYASGTEVYLNRFATVGLSPPREAQGAFLVGGEVYIETSKADRGFTVETPHGRAVAAGTRFGVEVQAAGTTVVVAEGRVTASTDIGGVELASGFEVRLPALESVPDLARRVRNVEHRFAWARGAGLKAAGRTPEGLVCLYLFFEGRGNVVHDVSGAGEPIDLVISGASFAWLPGGGLSFRGPDHNTIASSPSAPRRLYDACTATNELTIEAWFRTGNLRQVTARRIVDYESPEGEPANDRNCSLCQEGPDLNFRLRLSGHEDSTGFVTDTNPLADTRNVYHAVCTYGPTEGMKLYVNGVLRGRDARSGRLAGAWRPDYILSIGNRTRSLDRDWEGDIFLAAVYSRALSEEEIRRNLAAGPRPIRARQ